MRAARRTVPVNWARCHYARRLIRFPGGAVCVVRMPVAPFAPPPVPRRYYRRYRDYRPMRAAVSATNVVNFADVTNANNYTTGSWTPVANRLYLCAVCTSGTLQTVSSFTEGTGLAWVQVDTGVSNSERITVFRAMKPSGLGAGTTKANLSGTASRGQIVITEFQGTDTSGTDGSGAVVQSANNAITTNGTSLTVTLLSAIGGGNATFGAIGNNLNSSTSITQGSGYTELSELTSGEAQAVETQFKAAGTTTVDWTFTSSTACAVGVEIKAAAAGGGVTLAQIERPLTRGVGRGIRERA